MNIEEISIQRRKLREIQEDIMTSTQYSCLENPMDEGAWQAAVHGVAKSWTRLSDFTFPFHFHALEKEMARTLRCSCLENPRDGGAWWAAVYGVAQSRTRLKQLSSSSNDIHRSLILGKRNKQDKKETMEVKWMIGELRKIQNKGMRGLISQKKERRRSLKFPPEKW